MGLRLLCNTQKQKENPTRNNLSEMAVQQERIQGDLETCLGKLKLDDRLHDDTILVNEADKLEFTSELNPSAYYRNSQRSTNS